MALIDLKNATIRIEDGGSKVLVVKVGNGSLTFVERQAREYIGDRGILDAVRNGDETPVDVNMTFQFTFIKAVPGSGTPSVVEAIKGIGEAVTAGWVTSGADACEPYAVDLVIIHDPACAGEVNEKISLPEFRWEELSYDPNSAQISCAGKCKVTQAVIDRGEQYS